MQKFSRAVALLAILTLLLPVTILAQTSRTTGAITGTVTDTSGSPLPGVTVTVTSPNLQGSRTEVTDANGQYTIPALPPGTYRAEYTLSGVKSVVQEGIIVNVQRATAANVSMSLAVSETVTVTASQVVVDPTQAATQTTLDEETLKYTAVGSANRSYQNVLQKAPGVAGGANPQVSGANTAQNDWYVDGVNSTDPVTHTFGGNMAFDAIQEISIVTLGKDAEYKSSGGTVNVITKSGGNEFSGSFDYRYNDPDFLTQGKEKKYAAPSFYGGPAGAESLRYNKDVQTAKSEQPQATLGGPIMRDKLWFFGATHKPETTQQAPNVYGFQPGQRTFTGWNTHGKLTFTPWANQTFTGKFTDSHANVTNIQNSSLYPQEADARQTQHSRIWAVAYDAVLSSKWLANFQVSHRPASLAVEPMSGDLTTPGVYDVATGVRSVNYTNAQGRTSERNEVIASTTYYVEQFGTHAFKVGVNFDNNEFTSYSFGTGDPTKVPNFDASVCQQILGADARCSATIYQNNGAPYRVYLGIVNPESTVSAETRSFYIQDEWRPIPRLTTRIGIRYDGTTWDNEGGNPVPDFALWQPRFGIAYDVFNNASTVIHGYAGKIGDENQLTLPSYGVAQPLVNLIYQWDAATNAYKFVQAGSYAFEFGGLYDPDLKPSYSNQYSLGFTQRVWRNTSVDVTAEYRKQNDLFEDYCGTDEEPIDCVMTNNPGPAGIGNVLRSDWRGLITKIESRPYNWLDFSLSWTHAKSRGSTESTQNQNASFDIYSSTSWLDNFRNTYGYLSDDAKDRLKFNGFARLPWDFTVGASWNWDSGTAWSVTRSSPFGGTSFLEPRGSRRLPHWHQLDMQLQKDFAFRGVRMGIIGSVFNVMNKELPLTINGNAGTRAIENPNDPGHLFIDPNQQNGTNRLSPSFGQYLSYQTPRRFEVGVRFEF